MRIALIADIHANLPALTACLASIDEKDPDAIYCLGDLVGYNIWPNEVIDEIRRRRIPTIAGNYDQGIGLMSDDCGCAYRTDAEKQMGKISIAFTNSITEPEKREFLKTLPAHIKIEFNLEGKKTNLLLVHGSPRKVNEYLFEDREEQSLLRIMKNADADIMCFGHTHKPYHKRIESSSNGQTAYHHAINIGSVGKPKDGNPNGCYVLLTFNIEDPVPPEEQLKVEFIRFSYDIEKAAAAIENSPLPNEYAEMLRRGI